MEQNKEQSAPQEHGPAGPEQGLRSGSTAGDSHGNTADAPDEKVGNEAEGEQSISERRKELLKED